jgi:tripartite-type tricarboxylate transporter receptor subunit TctC
LYLAAFLAPFFPFPWVVEMTMQHHPRRSFIHGTTAAACALALPTARAQSSNGKILVGFAAGGSLDLLARITAEGMSAKLGKQFIVENKTGASGRLAVEGTKSAKPDGETLLVCPQGPLTLFPYIFKNLKFPWPVVWRRYSPKICDLGKKQP